MTAAHNQFDIPQMLLIRTGEMVRVVGQSPDLEFVLEEFARQTVAAYGDSAKDDGAVFALPANKSVIAVVSVRAAVFRFLFVPIALYRWIGDPFELADRFRVNVESRGSLPVLQWPDGPRPYRTVHELQRVLKAGDAPLLLGASQALLDGVRIRLVRSRPDPALLRSLWQLLPTAQRGELWPCEFCPNPDMPFHIAVAPVAGAVKPGTISEEQSKDYPEGRYELALQTAVEAGDQTALDRVLARRSPRDVLRTSLLILAFAVVMLLALRCFR